MRRFSSFIKRYVPIWALCGIILAAVTLILYLVSINIPAVADFLNGTLSAAYRTVMSYLTVLLPFSLFEILCILIIPAVIFFIVWTVRKGNRQRFIRSLFSILGVIAILFSAYSFGIGIGYHTTPVDERSAITEDKDITPDELKDTLIYLRDKVNLLSEQLGQGTDESRMTCSVSELSNKLVAAYGTVNGKYNITQNFYSRVKPMMFSYVMSDAGLLGMYTFFTGEANVNVEYPDYTVVFTSAHELAHQRGISRENEANFIAFLVCISSDDPYIQYCGYLNMYEYVASSLYRTDRELYREVQSQLCAGAMADIKAAGDISAQHRDSWFNKLVDILNDGYLKMNGTAGAVSYGYVVRLAVGYVLNDVEN